jgi:NAD(P)-dependent dehydrogenase (short-subunit alcohol dehydrogenase family)
LQWEEVLMIGNKVCVVTGAARGIGRATAAEMARQGARVVVTDIDEAGGAETARLITDVGGDAVFVRCDLTNRDEIFGMIEAAAEEYGGIDVLHNNAAVTESVLYGPSTIETLPEEIWDQIFAVNLRGAWLAIKAAAPYLRRSTDGPNIINASSVAGNLGYPNSTAYCASKAGLINLTRVAAVDLAADGIRCNCYCPGSIQTPQLEDFIASANGDPTVMSNLIGAQLIDRPGDPDEVAKLVCFLASDEAQFINGAVIAIDGGKMAWRGTRGA